MKWTDNAVILSTRRHGENSAVVRVLSYEHGVYAGVMRAANAKTQRGVAQVSNIVSATWNARLPEQLGTFSFELMVPSAAHLMHDGAKLSAVVAACSLIEAAMPERHPYPKLYRQLLQFLEALEHDENWPLAYVQLELAVLAESGFGLDLSACAATGRTDELIYVSPKSGRAVCADAGEPYKDKLLPLPGFLKNAPTQEKSQETLAGMRLSGYFLDSWLLAPHKKTLPAARSRLIKLLEPKLEHAT